MFASPLSPGSKVAMVGGGVDHAEEKEGGVNGALVAAAVAVGSGFAAWAVEQGGTFLIVYIYVYIYIYIYIYVYIGTFLIVEGLMKVTGTDSIRSLLEVLATWASSAGWQVCFPCILGLF